MSDLQGFTVIAQLGRQAFDVSLIASSPEAAIKRTQISMVLSRQDIRWIDATYEVTETVSLETFQAGRAAGTR